MGFLNNASNKSTAIVLFDGECVLCNHFFNLILKNDKKKQIGFGILQKVKESNLMDLLNFSGEAKDSVILIYENQIFTESTAVLNIFKILGGWRRLLYCFIVVPGFLRNIIYRLIARYRYKLFGKRDTCLMPDDSMLERFINESELQKIMDLIYVSNSLN